MAVLLVVGCSGRAPSAPRPAPPPPVTTSPAVAAPSKPAETVAREYIVGVTGEQLGRAYRENEVAAHHRFADRILVAEIRVTAIERDAFAHNVLRFRDGGYIGGEAILAASEEARAATLHRGDNVALRCVMGNFVMQSVVLNDCLFEEPSFYCWSFPVHHPSPASTPAPVAAALSHLDTVTVCPSTTASHCEAPTDSPGCFALPTASCMRAHVGRGRTSIDCTDGPEGCAILPFMMQRILDGTRGGGGTYVPDGPCAETAPEAGPR